MRVACQVSLPMLTFLVGPILVYSQTCDTQPQKYLLEEVSLWERVLGQGECADRVVLATHHLSLSDSVLVVDSFLARHSIWSVESEPYYDGDPLEWILKRALGPELQLLLKLDALQYVSGSACNESITMSMWSQGWSSSFSHVIFGLSLSMHLRRPFQIRFREPWVYAQSVNRVSGERTSVCLAEDITCYFLNISTCPAQILSTKEEAQWDMRVGEGRDEDVIEEVSGGMDSRWFDEILLRYSTRPRYWVRKAMNEQQISSPALVQPCAVMHVRRGDSKLLPSWKRKYHSIGEYVSLAAPELEHRSIKTILLMTDSSEAVREANAGFAGYSWWSLNKPRFMKAEGGLHDHVPSDASIEVVSILDELALAKKCELWIGGHSGYGNLLARSMCHRASGVWDCPQRVQLPKDDPNFPDVE